MLLEGKKIVILGVANKKSIAWGITEALKSQGAEIALTYVNEAIEKRVRPLAEEVGCEIVLPCDVTKDEEIQNLFSELKSKWGNIDGVVHSLAFAEREDLDNPFIQTSRKGFQTALDISAYSLVALANGAQEIMNEGGSMIALTYLGAERVVRNYNVMGVAKAALETSVKYLAEDLGPKNIRVNAISAGPIKTLAASGIPGFKDLLNKFASDAPLRRNVTPEDVGKTALYFMSDLSSGVTGEVTYVDGGFNVIGIA